ncbi:MAG: WbqC family protein [Flavobacteriales bacterium]
MDVVFSPHLFGSIAYFQELLKHENAVIDFGEHFVKQSPRNRFEIAGPNGRQKLTVNTKGLKGVKTPYLEVQLADDFMPIHLVRSLNTAYHKSPFYEFYKDEICEILLPSRKSLKEISVLSLEFCCEVLDLEMPIISDEYVEHADLDFRNESFFVGNFFQTAYF